MAHATNGKITAHAKRSSSALPHRTTVQDFVSRAVQAIHGSFVLFTGWCRMNL